MNFNQFLLFLAILFFVLAAFGVPAGPIVWQWLGFACWAGSGVAWRTAQA